MGDTGNLHDITDDVRVDSEELVDDDVADARASGAASDGAGNTLSGTSTLRLVGHHRLNDGRAR